MEKFADRVRRARKDAGLTQKQLAAASGLSQTTISDIERGRNETSADVVALARALKVLAEWLADGKGPRTLSEATGQPTLPAPALREPASPDLEQLTIEARAKIIAEQAVEVSSLWMALPEQRRAAVLRQLRAEATPQPGDARVITGRRATQGTKARQGAG